MKYAALILVVTIMLAAALVAGGSIINPLSLNGADAMILIKLRLPRMAAAFTAGAALAAAGHVFQALYRNPLADSYTTGISGGASFFAAGAIILGAPLSAVPLIAFAGAILSSLATAALSARIRLDDARLVLAGFAQSMFFSSALILLFTFSDSRSVHKAMLWMMGDLSSARYALLGPAAISAGLVMLLLIARARMLDIISFGQSFSAASGVTTASAALLFGAASLLTAGAISLAGIMPFIGLLVPHISRHFFGFQHIRSLPASAVLGGVLLVFSDALAKRIAHPYEMPAGAVTGIIGALFFLQLMLRRHGRKL